MNNRKNPGKRDKSFRATDRSIPIALSRAREAVMAHFRPLLAERGFTEQQWRVMRTLHESGPVDATQLADKAALLLPSLTRILKALELRDVIYRTGDQNDGRRFLIHLSRRSGELMDREAIRTELAYAAIEQSFGVEKTEQLLDLLRDLAAVPAPVRKN